MMMMLKEQRTSPVNSIPPTSKQEGEVATRVKDSSRPNLIPEQRVGEPRTNRSKSKVEVAAEGEAADS